MIDRRLGYCHKCGDAILPVFYTDKNNARWLSHGQCKGCYSSSVVEQMTDDEYYKLPNNGEENK